MKIHFIRHRSYSIYNSVQSYINDINNAPPDAIALVFLQTLIASSVANQASEFASYFLAIPNHIYSLYVGDIGCFEAFILACSKLPPHIRELTIHTEISGNSLADNLKIDNAINTIKSRIFDVTLQVMINCSGCTHQEAIQYTVDMPVRATYLKLNYVPRIRTASDVARYFRAIPEHIHSLNLVNSNIPPTKS